MGDERFWVITMGVFVAGVFALVVGFVGWDVNLTGYAVFDSSTSSGTYDGDSIYVNLTASGSTHYSFVDFEDDLVFWMRMDDIDGVSDVLDSSSYENTGSLIGTAEINSSSGYFGNGLWVDGNSDYINVPDSASLDSPGVVNRLTVCAWFNARDHQSTMYRGIVGKYNSGGRAYLLAGNNGDDKYGLYLSEYGTSLDATVLTDSVLNTDQWYHLCGVFDGSTASLYLDGVKQTATASLGGINGGSSSPLQIGEFWTDDRYFDGVIDEVIIFKRDLDDNEILSLYNSSENQYYHNFTGLSEGDYSFRGHSVNLTAYKESTSLRTVTLSSGAPPSSNLTLTLTSATNFENVFDIPYYISTNIAVDSCWFSRDGGTNVSMYETDNTTFWYDDNLEAGTYDVDFYCDNGSDVASLNENYVLRKSKVVEDVFYTNSQDLDIHFDFYFNSTNENGRIVIIPDSWSSTKDSYRDSVGTHFLNLGFVAVPLNTRGKGASEGERDAFGYECLDIYEAIEFLRTDSAYEDYVNDSVVYIWGFSGAGGKAGVCSAKYPDLFSAAFATGGALNITKWYTTNPSYQVSIEDRVGATPSGDPEAFLTREGSFLGENSETPIRVTQYTGDAAVSYLLARNYNESMVGYGKVIDYVEVAGGSHAILGLDESDEWFENHSSPVFVPETGSLKIGGYVGTKNFSVAFDEVSRLGLVDYDISGVNKMFNLTTYLFEGNANLSVSGLFASTDYTVSVDGAESIVGSDVSGDLNFNVSLTSSDLVVIIVSPAGPYCGDGSCNGAESCSSCSGDCGECEVPEDTSDDGGSGGGGIVPSAVGVAKLEVEGVNVIVSPGEEKSLLVSVKNIGRVSANKCSLSYSDYVDTDAVSNIGVGEIVEFAFVLSALDEGVKDFNLSVECLSNVVGEVPLTVVVLVPEVDVSIDEISFGEDGELLISYSVDVIGEFDGVLLFRILNSVGGVVAEVEESEFDGSVVMDISEVDEGMLRVVVSDEDKVSFVEEDFVYGGGAGLTGNVALDWSGNGSYIGVIVVLFLIMAVVLVRRIWGLKKDADCGWW